MSTSVSFSNSWYAPALVRADPQCDRPKPREPNFVPCKRRSASRDSDTEVPVQK